MNNDIAKPRARQRASTAYLHITGSSMAMAFALSVAASAHAQTARTVPANQGASASGEVRLEEIVVTARRTEERLQDIPATEVIPLVDHPFE